jgi:hypothetical protein
MNTVANNAQKCQNLNFLQTPHSQRDPPSVHGEDEDDNDNEHEDEHEEEHEEDPTEAAKW